MQGVVPISPRQDSVGVLARTLQDNLLVTAIISDNPKKFGMDEFFNFNTLKLQDKNLRAGLIKFSTNSSKIALQMDILERKLEDLAKAGFYFTNVTQDYTKYSGQKINFMIYTKISRVGFLYTISDIGYLIITIPLSIMEDGSPFDVSIYSRWGHEHVIYSIAQALDPKTSARKLPRFLDI
ncbi:hypothetical protein L0F63_003823 [Massospora cicadina]|nr:hypothetical protein L0F63_003823 [Massospora cicadina]